MDPAPPDGEPDHDCHDVAVMTHVGPQLGVCWGQLRENSFRFKVLATILKVDTGLMQHILNDMFAFQRSASSMRMRF